MGSGEMYYFKFVSGLIDRGIWARMSAAARALYPVLLRFSDRNYKPVYPGTQLLLRLTGFKQKSSLRKARKELVDLGLVSLTEGTGRKNTCYHFRFDWATQGGALPTPTGLSEEPSPAPQPAPGGIPVHPAGVAQGAAPYNQIHISINNDVPKSGDGSDDSESSRMEFLKRRFGESAVALARSECRLAGLAPGTQNIQKILYQNGGGHENSWDEVKDRLAGRISPGSLRMLEQAFRCERGGLFVFSDRLPEYLKELLKQVCGRLFFEPEEDVIETRRIFWKSAGAAP